MIPTKASHFWNWFIRNQDGLLSFLQAPENERAYRIAELSIHVKAYQRFLTPILVAPDDGQGRGMVIITADGRRKYFGMAERLVRKAPKLEGWGFLSLHPPIALEAYIEGELPV